MTPHVIFMKNEISFLDFFSWHAGQFFLDRQGIFCVYSVMYSSILAFEVITSDDGCVTFISMSFSIVFQSYQVGKMIMIDRVL